MSSISAKVYLVGAGPGDPGLITQRGVQILQRADIVFYDYLVNPLVLGHLREDAEKICLGRHGEGRILSQPEINARVLSAVKSGKQVVRLKGGDPAVFGRLSEEIASLREAGIAYEIVPGVTAASTASSHGGFPLTDRDTASCVAFITGQEYREKTDSSIDLANLAGFPGTLVFYMGVTTAPTWAQALIQHGKSPETPVAIVRHCSLPTQTIVRTTLAEIPQVLAPGKMRPPAVIIVGNVVRSEDQVNWFTSLPLFGRTVIITRPRHQAEELVEQFRELGANALLQPAIDISPPAEWTSVDAAIERLSQYDWLVFSSANGVHYFLDRVFQQGYDWRRLASCRIASIGAATTAALASYHLLSDFQPEEFRAESLAAGLTSDARGKRFLLLRASRGREVLAESLSAAGAEVEQVVVYQSSDIAEPIGEIAESLQAGQVDWITVTSSAIARSLISLFGENLKQAKLAAISPLTAGVLAEAGYAPTVVASQYTTDGLVAAILEHETIS